MALKKNNNIARSLKLSSKGIKHTLSFCLRDLAHRLAPSAPNQMGFSKVLSVYSLHPVGDTCEFYSFGRNQAFPANIT